MKEPALDPGSLFPDRGSRIPIVRQIADGLRGAIRNGTFAQGARLLPTRDLAAQLGTSRNTVVAAVEQLIAEGYLEARVGSGTFVAHGVVARESGARELSPRRFPPRAQRFLDVAAAVRIEPGGLGPFRDGIPDVTAFPTGTWERLERKARSQDLRLAYAEPGGLPALRERLAQHLRQFRGLTANARDIVVVEGAQSAFSLIAELMLDDGDAVLCDDPGYAAARAAFSARGARIVGVPVDDNGLSARGAPPARLAYVTPSHQFPLGGLMSARRRAELLDWARANDAYVVEDDYDSEFRFFGEPLPAIQGTDTDERVIYVGTFSKVLAPGLRLGYVVAPPHLTEAFRAACAVSSRGSSALMQAVVAELIAGGHLARHIRRRNAEYERRAQHLRDLLVRYVGSRVTIGPLTGGLHVAVRIDPALDDVALARRAAERGVYLYPLSKECIARTDLRGFVLGYGMTPCEQMEDAVRIVADVLGG